MFNLQGNLHWLHTLENALLKIAEIYTYSAVALFEVNPLKNTQQWFRIIGTTTKKLPKWCLNRKWDPHCTCLVSHHIEKPDEVSVLDSQIWMPKASKNSRRGLFIHVLSQTPATTATCLRKCNINANFSFKTGVAMAVLPVPPLLALCVTPRDQKLDNRKTMESSSLGIGICHLQYPSMTALATDSGILLWDKGFPNFTSCWQLTTIMQ